MKYSLRSLMPKRSWLQFSLRLAMLFMTLGALTLVLVRRGPENQRVAVRIAVSAGGHVEYTIAAKDEFWPIRQLRGWLPRDYFDSVAELHLDQSRVHDADLGHFAKLTQVKKIYLNPTHVTLAAANELQMALPNCRVFYQVGQPPTR